MKMTMGQLRQVIRDAIAGSQPEEAYSEELFDDPSFKEKSVYVPDSAKEKMKKWARDMKLFGR